MTDEFVSVHNAFRLRGMLSWMLLISVLLLLVGILAISLVFTFPSPDLFVVGPLAKFIPSEHPYIIQTNERVFYVVNDGEQILALYQKHPLSPFCPIRWNEKEARFIDPCRGTQFWINGMYMKGPPANMDRYPVMIQKDTIIVDLSQLLPRQPVKSDFPSIQ